MNRIHIYAPLIQHFNDHTKFSLDNLVLENPLCVTNKRISTPKIQMKKCFQRVTEQHCLRVT